MSPRRAVGDAAFSPRRGCYVWALVALVTTLATSSPAGAEAKRGAGKPAPAPKPAPGPDAKPDAKPETKPETDPAAKPTGGKGGKGGKAKVFDFTGLDLNGRLRTPQLLYFLERAAEELERASIRRRSFIPELVRSIDEESL